MEKLYSGKVRDIYEVSPDKLMLVASDRISAFDVVMPTPIPGKGRVLTKISSFWFDFTKDIVPNHMISSNFEDFPSEFQTEQFRDRSVLARKVEIFPYEFIVRGYLFGSMWNAYRKEGTFCGYTPPKDAMQAQKLSAPILTPSTKAAEGHDVNITFAALQDGVGMERAADLTDICLRLFQKCYDYAYERGVILADTKFEFGIGADGELVLADELFTPDSSRFWSRADYRPGQSPKSYDKQVLRDWLIENDLNGKVPGPELPQAIVDTTAAIYEECLRKLVP